MRRAALAAALVLAAPAGAALDGPWRSPEKPAPVAGPPGELVAVPGKGRTAPGAARVFRYTVEVEGGLRVDRRAFAAAVERVLADRRGWASAGLAFRRVSAGADLRVALASPSLTDRLCAPLPTNGIFSCASGSRAVLNARRWRHGADAYRGQLDRYRAYMVNHEVGHVLGHGHAWCPAVGAPAPVMMQQTKGLGGCRPNPWPFP
jgi:Protein of unknown function (DUF3152)